jgi:hypothetical protein
VTLLIFILLTLATWRVGRLLQLDDILAVPRDKFFGWLCAKPGWRTWLAELLSCAFCIIVWVALAAVLWWALLIAAWPGWPEFILYWWSTAGGAMLWWTIIDNDD